MLYFSGRYSYKKYFSLQGNIKYSKNTIYFSIIVKNTIYFFYTEENILYFYYILYFPDGTTILNSCHFIVTNTIYFSQFEQDWHSTVNCTGEVLAEPCDGNVIQYWFAVLVQYREQLLDQYWWPVLNDSTVGVLAEYQRITNGVPAD